MGDTGARPGEHPYATTRRLAAARLRHIARGWSEDDREEALSEVMTRTIAAGNAGHPAAWTFVALHALRHLRGWQVQGGRLRSARSVATPTAGPALQVAEWHDGERRRVDPGAWLDASLGAATRVDPEEALDSARRLAGWIRAAADVDDGPALVRRLVAAGLCAAEIAAEVGADPSAACRWVAGKSAPHAAVESALRDAVVKYAPHPSVTGRPAGPRPASGSAVVAALAGLRAAGWCPADLAAELGTTANVLNRRARGVMRPQPAAERAILELAASGRQPPRVVADEVHRAEAARNYARTLRATHTLAAIGRLAGSGESQVRAWLAGRNRPSAAAAERLLAHQAEAGTTTAAAAGAPC